MSRLTLTIALLASVIPSIGMAGVITDANQISQCSVSASLDADETPAPDSPHPLIAARNMLGITVNSVPPISSSLNAIGGWSVLFVNSVPLVESTYAFYKWQFVPDSPVLKIPKVPIVRVLNRWFFI